MTVIVDLGCANLASVGYALERLGVPFKISRDASEISAADRIILPGVGSASFSARQLDSRELRAVLVKATQPILGVCLGMQLLYETSEEGDAICLGLLSGMVTRLEVSAVETWPHMGWSRLRQTRNDSRLLSGIDDGAYAYFVHGFCCPIDDATVGEAEYGARFAAAVEKDNVFGCQFHPERSSAMGAKILKNFLEVPC
ncbi:MAG: imidazole glycerol phosphate synthase subunit HisH [Marinicaulis sp.]|nr:imidazole glycerol phosphate synthase subunit HisH [Marinicaulis sp.]NNE40997.1 imidazole glycerol phosphate synthase subunit HisH [Marinicaulis sp.]NNL88670.1 imidazole glycerol phosphate synthase subunit HisH [Marinicaulis sp.]